MKSEQTAASEAQGAPKAAWPNPGHQGTTHLVRRTLDGVVGSLNQEGA